MQLDSSVPVANLQPLKPSTLNDAAASKANLEHIGVESPTYLLRFEVVEACQLVESVSDGYVRGTAGTRAPLGSRANPYISFSLHHHVVSASEQDNLADSLAPAPIL